MAPYLDDVPGIASSVERDVSTHQRVSSSEAVATDHARLAEVSKPDLLQASPYASKEHLLDLKTLTEPLQLFAKALVHMQATRPDYATAPYYEAFNWNAIVKSFARSSRGDDQQALPESLHFFVIVFRSRVNADADRFLLGELDATAHIEAVKGGGLLKYWFGVPDGNGRNLATCIWRDREDARLGGAGPGHAAAMRAARRMYNEWYVEQLKLSVDARTGAWALEEWTEVDSLV